MIEDAVIEIDGQEVKTRLHEHGQGRYDDGEYVGYFDGTPEAMQFLKEKSQTDLVIKSGEVMHLLYGVKWKEAYESYPGHWIAQVTWEHESRWGETEEERRIAQRREEMKNVDRAKVAEIRAEIKHRLATVGF